MKKRIMVLVALALAGSACHREQHRLNRGYVPRDRCVSCHEEECNEYRGSHHDRAMEEATKESVLGDFGGVEFVYGSDTARFFREGNTYYVRTQNERGIPQVFPVRYTFGFTPLQQYLIEFPGGKFQVLPYCWDSRKKEEGGQRWFHIYGSEVIAPTDPLYWTGKYQNWNHACAECHSTNFRKNFDATKRRYQSSWSEIDVSCDACHGPSENHLKWADLDAEGKPATMYPNRGYAFHFQSRDSIPWVFNLDTGIAYPGGKVKGLSEIEVCARCHSRRQQIWDNYQYGQAIDQTHLTEVLEPELYYPDGQIKDEVYVYGSFLQSKMYRKGVSCTDCHDPHSMKVEAPDNVLCAKCHVFTKYNSREHHFHNPDSTGGNCRECHMPRTTYMGVDRRLDHSIRIPRPDLSLKIGTPNACTRCHTEETDPWAAQWFKKWYGQKYESQTHYGEVFNAAMNHKSEAFEDLLAIASDTAQNDIVRASALRYLEYYPTVRTLDALAPFRHDPLPMVRRIAVRTLARINGEYGAQTILQAMNDPQRAVRYEAYQGFVNLPLATQQQVPTAQQKKHIREYLNMLMSNPDQAASYINLGIMYMNRNNPDSAQILYKKALQIDSSSLEAGINLADLYRASNQDEQGYQVLREQLLRNPHRAEIYHALGMWYTRQKQPGKALEMFATAVDKAPSATYYQYVYAVALHSMNRKQQAEQVLLKAYALNPYDYNVLYMLTALYKELGNQGQYQRYYNELQELGRK